MLNQEEPVSVGQRLAMVADRSPAAPALVTDDHVLSYQELRDRVARLAGLLADRGVRPGEPVGLLLERGSDFVVGWLAAIWLGAVALPLDPADPADRNTGVLRRCGARAVLTHARHTGQLGPTQPLVVAVDRERLAAATATAVAPAAVPDGRAPAAICCTSGSTGLPKTVLVPHEAVLAGADFVARHCGAGAGDGHVLKTAVNFTSVLRQVGWPLLTGGWAYVLPASAGQDLTVLSRALTVHPITMCSFFPSTLNAMLAAGLPIGDSLRHLMFGGEPLPGELVRRAAGATGAELHNVYGMTECNLALWLRCPPDAEFEVAPLGEPVDGLTVTVDESAGHGEGVPGGAGPAPGATAPASVGELVVAGTHVALGYAGQPELTAERFDVTDDGQRRFRTRDLVVPDTGGSTRSALRYAGRVDDRVKVRGYAVELGAVEQILRRHPAVLDCVVGVRDLGLSDQRLESFVVTGPIPVSVNELRGHLRRELPDYLVPTVLRLVAELPRLNNGKVDRRGLFAGPGPDTDLTDSDQPMASVVMPSDVVVEADRPGPDWIDQARQLYAEALQTSPDKVDDTLDFFDLGGHSLLVLRLVTLIEDRLGVIIEMDEALAAPTARQLAGLLAERASGPPGTTPEAG